MARKKKVVADLPISVEDFTMRKTIEGNQPEIKVRAVRMTHNAFVDTPDLDVERPAVEQKLIKKFSKKAATNSAKRRALIPKRPPVQTVRVECSTEGCEGFDNLIDDGINGSIDFFCKKCRTKRGR